MNLINQTETYKIFLHGFWESSKQFCSESGLKYCALWINADQNTMYIIMEKDSHFLINKTVSYKLTNTFFQSDLKIIRLQSFRRPSMRPPICSGSV